MEWQITPVRKRLHNNSKQSQEHCFEHAWEETARQFPEAEIHHLFSGPMQKVRIHARMYWDSAPGSSEVSHRTCYLPFASCCFEPHGTGASQSHNFKFVDHFNMICCITAKATIIVHTKPFTYLLRFWALEANIYDQQVVPRMWVHIRVNFSHTFALARTNYHAHSCKA